MDSAAVEKSVQQMSVIANQSKGWLKFIGVLIIIYGILIAFSIVGILIAWLPIWMGVLLFQAGSQVDALNVSKDPDRLVMMLSKLKTYFVIQGVLALIALIIVGLSIIMSGGAIFSLMNALN